MFASLKGVREFLVPRSFIVPAKLRRPNIHHATKTRIAWIMSVLGVLFVGDNARHIQGVIRMNAVPTGLPVNKSWQMAKVVLGKEIQVAHQGTVFCSHRHVAEGVCLIPNVPMMRPAPLVPSANQKETRVQYASKTTTAYQIHAVGHLDWRGIVDRLVRLIINVIQGVVPRV